MSYAWYVVATDLEILPLVGKERTRALQNEPIPHYLGRFGVNVVVLGTDSKL